MKKLLISLMVLGLVSTANAALEITQDGQAVTMIPPGDQQIGVSSTDTSTWVGYIIVEEGGVGVLADAVVLEGAGDLGAAAEYAEDGWGAGYELVVAASPTGTPVVAGPQFTMNIVGGVEGDMIPLYVDPDYEVPVAVVEVIPEPATLMLLGLGGLFLRRRR